MSTWVKIKKCIIFSPNHGVLVESSALELTGEEIKNAISLAHKHINDKPFIDACCGGIGALADLGEITFDDYLVRLKDIDIQKGTSKAKRKYTKIRRTQYSSLQPQLVLALIENGVQYVCSHPQCKQTTDLTIDHIIPLSKGGSDEIKNLQFMCRPHNSSKGDR